MSIFRNIFGLTGPGSPPPTFAVDPVTLAAARRVERGGHCACLEPRGKRGAPSVPRLHSDIQDSSAPGWQALLALIAEGDTAAAAGFEPSAGMPADRWSGVIALPPEMQSLAGIRHLRLYGSHLRRLPPEIGRLEAMENLDIYTSYSLHWLPYEITRCARLRETRMSTRALYGNAKTRLPFPRLSGPVDVLVPGTCSVCDGPFGESRPQVLWTTQRIGTDIAPLLIHSCSTGCTGRVPDAPKGYHSRPHRGGGGVGMPDPDFD
ncbi:MAG: hypothetical protein ABWX67_15880 [Allosphingosinicella sp.]